MARNGGHWTMHAMFLLVSGVQVEEGRTSTEFVWAEEKEYDMRTE